MKIGNENTEHSLAVSLGYSGGGAASGTGLQSVSDGTTAVTPTQSILFDPAAFTVADLTGGGVEVALLASSSKQLTIGYPYFGDDLGLGEVEPPSIPGPQGVTGATGATLTIEESDGSPTNAAITKIVVPNDSLSIAGSVATLRQVPYGFIGVAVRANAATAVAHQTFTRLLWQTEQYDTDNFHDTSTNTGYLTVPAGLGGKYLITCNISWASNTSGERIISVYKNGAEVGYLSRLTATNGLVVSAGVIQLDLVAGDYIELLAYQTSGGSLNVNVNLGTYDNFAMTKLDAGRVGSGIGCRAWRTTTQSIVTGTFTAIGWDSEAFDTDGYHDNTTNNSRLTIPTGLGGKYLVVANLEWAGNGSGERIITIHKNGDDIGGWVRAVAGATGESGQTASTIVDLVSGDYIELKGYQTSGGNLNANPALSTTRSSLSIMRLDTVGSSGYREGTAFPTGPATNDKYYRTDLNMLFYFDGTRWLSAQLNQLQIGVADAVLPNTTGTGAQRAIVPVWAGSDIWLVSTQTWFYVQAGTALGASHKWVGIVVKQPAGTTLDTVNIDSGASDTYRQSAKVDIGAALGTTNFVINASWTKTGTPGALYTSSVISFRYVAT